jgi:hypothetical protein
LNGLIVLLKVKSELYFIEINLLFLMLIDIIRIWILRVVVYSMQYHFIASIYNILFVSFSILFINLFLYFVQFLTNLNKIQYLVPILISSFWFNLQDFIILFLIHLHNLFGRTGFCMDISIRIFSSEGCHHLWILDIDLILILKILVYDLCHLT